jgi:uncharacterized Zn finger protein
MGPIFAITCSNCGTDEQTFAGIGMARIASDAFACTHCGVHSLRVDEHTNESVPCPDCDRPTTRLTLNGDPRPTNCPWCEHGILSFDQVGMWD